MTKVQILHGASGVFAYEIDGLRSDRRTIFEKMPIRAIPADRCGVCIACRPCRTARSPRRWSAGQNRATAPRACAPRPCPRSAGKRTRPGSQWDQHAGQAGADHATTVCGAIRGGCTGEDPAPGVCRRGCAAGNRGPPRRTRAVCARFPRPASSGRAAPGRSRAW